MNQVQRLTSRLVYRSLQTSSRSLAAEDSRSGPSNFNNRNTGNVSTPASPNRPTLGQSRAARLESGQPGIALTSRASGKYYSPSFLNIEEHEQVQRKPRRNATLGPSAAVAKQMDPLYRLGLHPGHPSLDDDSYKNPLLLGDYVTEMGKIKGRKDTQLTRRSQREVGKAIRRARSMGLMPVMSKNHAWRRYNK